MTTAEANVPRAVPVEHARMVRKETVISIVVNAAIAGIITTTLFGDVPRVPLWGKDGGAFGMLPGTFIFTLLFSMVLALVIRGRVRSGAIRRLGPDEGPALGAGLPANLVLRGFALAIVITLVMVSLAWGLLWLVAPPEWSFGAVLALNVGYFALVSLVITPIIVWRALRDGT